MIIGTLTFISVYFLFQAAMARVRGILPNKVLTVRVEHVYKRSYLNQDTLASK